MLKKKQLLLDERFSMTLCMTVVMVSAFVLALHLKLLHSLLSISSIFLGTFIGWWFSRVMKAPAKVLSLYSGAMGAIMGSMLAVVMQNPAVCNIPLNAEEMLVLNMYRLAFFITILHTITMLLIRYSFRV
ncbi:hypothetical protein [Bacillus sp. REN10]|uniref:hypothetical protein n=1 Tax=Bacillus sp. REN10 TaxID=2782541 RepID=UPI00193B48E7|nr:hypothetical protein [Bacillus sp. REN10]